MTNELKIKISKLINGTSFSIVMALCAILVFGVRLQDKVDVNARHITKNEIDVKETKGTQIKLITDVAVIKATVTRIEAKL